MLVERNYYFEFRHDEEHMRNKKFWFLCSVFCFFVFKMLCFQVADVKKILFIFN